LNLSLGNKRIIIIDIEALNNNFTYYIKDIFIFYISIFWWHYWTIFTFFHRVVSNTLLSVTMSSDFSFFFCLRVWGRGHMCTVFVVCVFLACHLNNLTIFFIKLFQILSWVIYYFQLYCYLRKYKSCCLETRDFISQFSNWTVTRFNV